MLNTSRSLPLSPFSDLYDILLPKDNLYRRLADEIDYSFVYEALSPLYDSRRGRYGVDPDRMIKILMLKAMTEMSDRDLVEEINYNMAFKYFLGMRPEEKVIDSSTLAKFRTQRLKNHEELVNDLLMKTVSIAIERGVISCDSNGKATCKVSYDATHIETIGAITDAMRGAHYYISKLYSRLENKCEGSTASFPKIPKKFASAEEALDVLIKVTNQVRQSDFGVVTDIQLRRLLNRMEEAITDYQTIGTHCAADRDARIGHKSVTKTFGGYKNSIGTEVESGLIVSIKTTQGNASDTTVGREMITADIKREDIKIIQILGDAAYGPSDLVEKTKQKGIELIAPHNGKLGSSNIKRDGYTFDKDSGMVVCPNGQLAIYRTRRRYPDENNRIVDMYYFDIEKCRICRQRDQCLKHPNAKSKSYSVTINTEEQKKRIKECRTKEFKEKYRKRSVSERTNSVLKKSFGLKNAYGKELNVVTVQSAVAAIAYNLRLITNKTDCK